LVRHVHFFTARVLCAGPTYQCQLPPALNVGAAIVTTTMAVVPMASDTAATEAHGNGTSGSINSDTMARAVVVAMQRRQRL